MPSSTASSMPVFSEWASSLTVIFVLYNNPPSLTFHHCCISEVSHFLVAGEVCKIAYLIQLNIVISVRVHNSRSERRVASVTLGRERLDLRTVKPFTLITLMHEHS